MTLPPGPLPAEVKSNAKGTFDFVAGGDIIIGSGANISAGSKIVLNTPSTITQETDGSSVDSTLISWI